MSNGRARIHRRIGAEIVLVEKLKKQGISIFNSLSSIENHISNSESQLLKLKMKREQELKVERTILEKRHRSLLDERNLRRKERMDQLKVEQECLRITIQKDLPSTSNPFKWLWYRITRFKQRRRLNRLDTDFLKELDWPFRNITKTIISIENQIKYINQNFDFLIQTKMQPEIIRKQRIDRVLMKLYTWLAGARGEFKTLKSLSELSNEYVIINDVYLRFAQPVKTDKGMRNSCQIDHVVIGPSGVFNIESKNWSKESINRLDLRSPVQQVRTNGRILWRVLNRAISKGKISARKHHWGIKEVPVRNILAMSGSMPDFDFQYVKMLSVSQICKYIKYNERKLDSMEIRSIEKWLLQKMPARIPR